VDLPEYRILEKGSDLDCDLPCFADWGMRISANLGRWFVCMVKLAAFLLRMFCMIKIMGGVFYLV